jgi:fucose permease
VTSTKEHTSIMNAVEGFFGIGSIIGPAILARLLIRGLSWQWLYVIAGTMCVLLIVTAASVRYPAPKSTDARTLNWIFNPTLRVFRHADETDYSFAITEGVTNETP